MRKIVLFFALTLALVSCSEKSKEEKKIEEIKIPDVTIERLDRTYFEVKAPQFGALKQKYNDLFPPGTSDAEWLARRNEPFLKELQAEVQRIYKDLDTLEIDMQVLFKHIKYYYPGFKVPRVVTMVNDNLEYKAGYNGKTIAIPLSLYLGRGNKYYQGLDGYLVQQYDPSQILPDIVTSFSTDKIAAVKDASLLSYMIYYGKLQYLKDRLIPDVPDHDKMGYTKLQLQWAKENEAIMWSTLINEKLLYSTDRQLPRRFIFPAPFTRFGLEIDNDSPGRLGQWLGWQIVRSYMDNNKNVTLQELLAMDAKTIFEKSKYKPNK
jgi:gliding motility-associated lipoprotein GldB